MKVLVGCEYSGTVRDAFIARGHDAVSCDLLPTDSPGPHYTGDVLTIIAADRWDLAIFHPPCTYLTRSGERWLHAPDDHRPDRLKGAPRRTAAAVAVEFMQALLNAEIPRVAVENPQPGANARRLGLPLPDQYVHPWQFGHAENKRTGLWLRNLPPLVPTTDLRPQMATMTKAETDRMHRVPPSPDRWKIRSATYAGIAAAMADQWGSL